MANYTNHSNNKKLAQEVIDEIKHRVEVKGEPKTHVAKALGVSHSVVRKYTKPRKDFFLSDSIKQQAAALVDKGYSRTVVAKHLNISRESVSKIKKGKKSERLSDATKATLIERVANGETPTEVARNLGIDAGNARRICEISVPINISIRNAEELFIERVLLGEKILPVAKDLKISTNRAYCIGRPLMNEPTKDQFSEIRKRLAKGQSRDQIALDLKIRLAYIHTLDEEPIELVSDGRYVSEETKARAVELLKAGLTAIEVGGRLNLTRQFVGLLRQSHKVSISSETKRKVLEEVKLGKPVAQIARKYGIEINWAHKIIEAVMPRPSEEQALEMRRLRSEGKNYTQIAKELKTVKKAVSLILGPQEKSFTDEEELDIAKQVSAGLMFKDLRARFGITGVRIKGIYEKYLKKGLVKPRLEINMEDDRNLLRIGRQYPQYEEWRQYALRYYQEVGGNYAIVVTGIHRFFDYLEENKLYASPADFLLRNNKKTIPKFFENKTTKSDHGAAINNAVVEFLDWILVQDEFVDTNDEDVPETLSIFKNPLSPVRRSDHGLKRLSASNKKTMPYWMVQDLRRRIIEGPNFKDWTFVHKLYGRETTSGDKDSRDWFEVTEDRIDKSDPDCVWRLRERLAGPPLLEMWSPVRTVANLLKLQTTARLGQIRMLDSGEADTFVFTNGEFVVNPGKLKRGTTKRPRQQGAIRRGDDGTEALFFNTNKTQDIKKIGEEKGQLCPWPRFDDYRDDPYWLIQKMIQWQGKYNPVNRSVAWAKVPSYRRLRGKSEVVCSTYPDVTFLLRTPEAPGEEMFPVSYGACYKAWQSLMAAYEELLAKEGKRHSDGSPIRLTQDGKALITPHGLRVSLITHLILDGGMPVELMVRIVGHARFIMTIYYVKPGLERLQQALKSATEVLEAKKDHTLIRDLRSMQLEELRDRVVTNAVDLSEVIPIDPTLRNPIGWLEMHDGICLAGGNTGPVMGDYHVRGCHNGGPMVSKIGKNALHEPTPGGLRNCTQCRWKCAGKSHLLGLQATFNNKQYHLHRAGEAAIESEKKRFEVMEKKARIESQGQPFMDVEELAQAERLHLAAMQKMEQLAIDLRSVHVMMERILKLPDEKGKLPLVSQADMTTLEAVIEDTDSELLTLAELCEDIEFYPDLDAGNAIFEYSRLLDLAFEREGHPMVLARLTENEKLIACNAIMRELEHKANPENPHLGRKMIAETMDRGDSLKKALGIKSLAGILQSVNSSHELSPLRLANKGVTP